MITSASGPKTPRLQIRRRRAGCGAWAAAFLVGILCATHAGTAFADTRDDIKAAHEKALEQFKNVELEAAGTIVDEAIAAASADAPDDPALAPLYVLKASVVYNNTGEEEPTIEALKKAVAIDYHVSTRTIPADFRSEEFQALVEKAREGASAPDEAVRHEAPTPTCGEAIEVETMVSGLVDAGQAALYWRVKGEGEFKSVSLDLFGNLGTASIGADEHGDKDIEYFFYVYDGANKPVANKGTEEAPIELALNCVKEEPKPDKPKPPPAPKWPISRFWINLGVGTGFGVASGTAEQSYQQFSGNDYGYREVACAISRWIAAGGDPNPISAQDVMQWYEPDDANIINAVVMSYEQDYCAARHPVKTGFALAAFHVEPEFGFRVHPRITIGLFARIQAVTGASVFRDDPDKDFASSFNEDVRSGNPQGVRTNPGFTIAGGAKLRYFFGKDEKKFRPFVGGFLGGGFARLRVNMGFPNDRNGNSIPDTQEVSSSISTGQCVAVWPYNAGCSSDPNAKATDDALVMAVAAAADSKPRIDTVRIGPLMVGAMGGFNYQVVKNFALFGEVQIGGWFWNRPSLLFDIVVGPAITF